MFENGYQRHNKHNLLLLGWIKTLADVFIKDKSQQVYWNLIVTLILGSTTESVIYPGYDIKLIRCCPQYDVKLIWRHRENDIVSVAAICAAAQLIFIFGHTRLAV